MARVLINAPRAVRPGQVFEVRALIQHVMETGFRHNEVGQAIPRDIIHRVVCTYNGEEVFRADLFPAISANPFVSFTTVARDSGEIALTWTDDHGRTQTETVPITIE